MADDKKVPLIATVAAQTSPVFVDPLPSVLDSSMTEMEKWMRRALDAEQRLAEVERDYRKSYDSVRESLEAVADERDALRTALAEATRTVEAMRPVVDAVLRWDGYASGTNESLLEDAVDAYRATSGTVQHTMADGGSGPTTGANCLCHLDNAVTRISCPLHGDYKETP